jgi:hypothetical protein
VFFWLDRWLDDSCIHDNSPVVFISISLRQRNKHTVQEELLNDRWTLDIVGDLPPEAFQQYVLLSMAILNLSRDPKQEDRFSWPCDPAGVFSAKCSPENTLPQKRYQRVH